MSLVVSSCHQSVVVGDECHVSAGEQVDPDGERDVTAGEQVVAIELLLSCLVAIWRA